MSSSVHEVCTQDDSWLPTSVQVLGSEPFVLIYTPCSNQYLTFPLLMMFFHSSIYNLTLLFCPIFYPTFSVMTWAVDSGLEMNFSMLLLSQSNAFSLISCGCRSCLSLTSLKIGFNGCFCVCQWCPAGRVLFTGEARSTSVVWRASGLPAENSPGSLPEIPAKDH